MDPDPANRRFKFCAIFDNGRTDPETVKRNSESPVQPLLGSSCTTRVGGFLPAAMAQNLRSQRLAGRHKQSHGLAR